APGGMHMADRVPEIGAGMKVSAGVGKGAGQHKDFFAERMIMTLEAGTGVVADNTGGMAALRFGTRQRLAPDAGLRAWNPVQPVGVDDQGPAEIHVKHMVSV